MHDHLKHPTAIRVQFAAIFGSLELSRKTWLITSFSPGKGEKMSKHSVTAGDIAGLKACFADSELMIALWRYVTQQDLRSKVRARFRRSGSLPRSNSHSAVAFFGDLTPCFRMRRGGLERARPIFVPAF